MFEKPARWIGFIAMCLGMFMAILDIQIVVTSLPAISAALDIPADRMSWVQTAYLIAEVIAIPLTGFLTRCLGLRVLFLISLSVFLLASLGCAYSGNFEQLIVARTIQGFSGGCLIPLVFSAVFLMFPEREQALATTVAGGLAVLAPTIGPTVGGYITETFNWSWLFLVNIGPGVIALAVAAVSTPRAPMRLGLLARLDWVGVLLLGTGLTCLELGLKDGPQVGWSSVPVLLLLTLSLLSAGGFVARTLSAGTPVARLRLFADRNFAVACGLSFLFGIGLFASVYLMPVFLGLVRGHTPFEIGLTMLVTGAAQLATAPIAVQLERRIDPRILSGLGFLGFAIGLGMSGFQTTATDFDEMFWPQIVRGVSIMFCLLPPTRLALGLLRSEDIPDGSALFNLMRNLGGAIGIALVDTVLWQRAPHHAAALGDLVLAKDAWAADFVGIPLEMIPSDGAALPPDAMSFVRPMFENAGLVLAVNEAWLLIAGLTVLGLVILLFAYPMRPDGCPRSGRPQKQNGPR